MSTKPQIGKNIYRGVLWRGRNQTQKARAALSRILYEEPGPQTQAILITKVAVALGEIESVFSELDEIGRNARKKEGRQR
jgi:hypothetical protein